jgi:tRNA U34 5-methylaminomethyl-2-thiouridine-forming methyltransferase MnmC
MSEAKHNLILSHDGSHTIESAQYGVTYHSAFGALEESLTVFLSAGYHHSRLRHKPDQLDVLEVGFGTGLNAWLTIQEAERYRQLTTYTGIEAYPITADVAEQLNYPSITSTSDKKDAFIELHNAASSTRHRTSDYSIFNKEIMRIEDWEAPQSYDVIYFDAFAPTAQPELWSQHILQKMYDCTKPGGVLVTYCAKGQFKRDLRAVGYQVEALPGPGRKREMTRAIKSST